MAETHDSRNFIGAEVAAALIRVTPRRLQQLTSEGWIKREGRGQYTIRGVVHGYLDFKESEERRAAKSAADSRVRDARAREIELRTAREEGELVPVAEAVAFVQGIVGAYISRLNGLPAQITRDLDERRRIETILDGIRSEVDSVFEEYAVRYRSGPPPEPAVAEDDAD